MRSKDREALGNREVYYENLCPKEFRQRLEEMPIAYLPLGTLEWHGPHLPLGADGIQAKGLFQVMAQEVGGIVLPPLFVGPDRMFEDGNRKYYGMDINTGGTVTVYDTQQLTGSAYWVPSRLFEELLMHIVQQLHRAGFKVVIGHGHGPSIQSFQAIKGRAREEWGMALYTAWDFAREERLKFQNDHAGANETSLMMALKPELVHMQEAADKSQLIGVAGENPLEKASAEFGQEMIRHALENMEVRLKKECGFLGL